MIQLGLNLWAIPPRNGRSEDALRKDLKHAAALGYQCVEATCGPDDRLQFGDDLEAAQTLKRVAGEVGLKITSLCSGATWDAPLNAQDAETRRRADSSVRALIVMAAALGDDVVVLLTPGTSNMPGATFSGTDTPSAWKRALEAIGPLADFAQEHGVRLALENSWTRFLNSPLEARRFLEELHHPQVGWYLDLGNAALMADPLDWIRTLGTYLWRVQAKDFTPTSEGGVLGVPGEGTLDYVALVQALSDANYDGALSVEAPADGNGAATAARFLAAIPGIQSGELSPQSSAPARMKEPTSPGSNRLLRVGLVGLGNMGRLHAGCLLKHPRVQVHSVVEPSGNFVLGPRPTMRGIRRLRRILGWSLELLPEPGVHRYRSLEQMLGTNDLPDAVWLCTPTDLHHEQVTALHAAGIDVFCEKPLARTSEQAESLVGQSSPKLCVGQVLRFWPEWRKLNTCIQEKRFGALCSLDLWRFSGRPQHAVGAWLDQEDRSGGALLDLHIHEADLVLGLPWKLHRIDAKIRHDAQGLPQEIQAQYHFEEADAPQVTCRSGWLLPPGFPFQAGFRARFESGTLAMNDGPGGEGLRFYPEAGACQVLSVKGDPFMDQLDAVVAYLLEGKDHPLLQTERAAEALGWIESIQTSSDDKRSASSAAR